MQPRHPGRCAQGLRTLHLVACRRTQAAEMKQPAFGNAKPGTDRRIRLLVEEGMQRIELRLRFLEMAMARKKAGAFGAQAGRLDGMPRLREGRIEPREQPRLGNPRVHAVSRCSASRYLAAVFSMTSAGSAGAGAFLPQGLPSTMACSSQSRTNCLS